ncbi:D-glycero-beta-D-manno-heptose 1-phosphate adenylyltransferase [Candidatus Dependentiae bacterium]|nr:D-glycero-beta-D-manno-heptose 1-phosphate adenylyltransferase [Candidatus Dependentiae bacterium]MBU4386979.1 D-glycero-beta-D-manno-heptose 1-phosphate adenylyltransferase [Candidatus Dependentiae bacterium]MCG2756125.1 D-glycero-beta-D-manno-heptose 1-phosphate adenylyltransferase [Candidatus Dependentiae bacterium]
MKNLIKIIQNSSSKNILIIGDVMLDEYIFGTVSRISPEAPVPVLKEEKMEWCLGGAANVALNCKNIGCNVNIVGIINDMDFAGQKLASMLSENGISSSNLIKSEQRITTCKKRALCGGHQLLRIDNESEHNLTDKELLLITEKINNLIVKDSIILISDYAKGVISSELVRFVSVIAKSRNCKIIVDPKGKNFEKYIGVNYIKPNYKEFLLMLDVYGLDKNNSISNNAKILCEKLSIDGLIITLGEKGIHFVSKDEDIFVSALKKEVYDLTGAGDTVLAFLALGLSVGFDMQKCLQIANTAAGVAVSHLKTYAVSLEELLDKNIYSSEKIYENWTNLKIELDWIKAQNKKIVFTNGCFDLLHSGHIYLLNEAKKLGDILVVAINTDESVKRYKGQSRPINSLYERMHVMSSLGIVDFVVSFEQDTPKELIEYLSPDVLVKGGDYKAENVAGADFVKKSGGQVAIIEYQVGLSTTNIVKKISTVV